MFVPPPHLLSGDIAHLLSNDRGRPSAHARLQKECLDLSSEDDVEAGSPVPPLREEEASEIKGKVLLNEIGGGSFDI